MDKIIIKNLEVFAYHGVNPEEKRDGQRFLLDVTLFTDLTRASRTDSLEDTINYAGARKVIQAAMTDTGYDLIERAAGEVADRLLREFPALCRVKVLLKKPDAPMSATFDYVAVEITRERP